MPSKKNNNKKADNWESELGETAKPVAAQESKDEPAEADVEEEFPAGGLMAMMRKNKKKKNKEGPAADVVEGEDPPTEHQLDLAVKAPEEAMMEDEFALPEKKGKGKGISKPAKDEDDEEEERGADDHVMTKKEKERVKKEREKQRKKEQVGTTEIENI
jgi:translation initiation factor 5B